VGDASLGRAAGREVRFEADDRGGVTVVRDGHPQSHVCLTDPEWLAFDYVARLALAIDAAAPEPAPGVLRVTHVGGAGMTLARWVQATRPGSPQIVLEPDVALTEAVRAHLPLPRGHRIRVRAETGRDGVAGLRDASADVVVLDAYADGRVPADLVSVEFFEQVCRVLTPGGLLAANLADEPGLRHTARVVAGIMRAGLGDVALVASHEVLKGRRFGNVVVAARRGPCSAGAATPAEVATPGGDASPGGASTTGAAAATGGDASRGARLGELLRRPVASASLPTGIRAGGEVRRWLAGALPFTDGDALPSPEPPPLGSWRVR